MTQITKMDRKAVQEISKAAELALREVAEQFGINLTAKGGKFDPTTGTFVPKFEFSVEGASANEWATSVHLIGGNYGPRQWLHAEDFGKTFTSQGKTFELSGINLRAPKFPINAKCLTDGKTYKFTSAAIRRALGRTAPVSE
jgi:hypothetical protein